MVLWEICPWQVEVTISWKDFSVDCKDRRECDEKTENRLFVDLSGIHWGLSQALVHVCCFRGVMLWSNSIIFQKIPSEFRKQQELKFDIQSLRFFLKLFDVYVDNVDRNLLVKPKCWYSRIIFFLIEFNNFWTI